MVVVVCHRIYVHITLFFLHTTYLLFVDSFLHIFFIFLWKSTNVVNIIPIFSSVIPIYDTKIIIIEINLNLNLNLVSHMEYFSIL